MNDPTPLDGSAAPESPALAADTAEVPPQQPDADGTPGAGEQRSPLELSFYAVSDVGRVRKDNQDSGYAGPWLLAVCDGVGGAARGDIASSIAVNELRQLDEPPGSVDLIDRINDGLHEAHVSIGAQVDQDPSLNGTSTTATVALFDGRRLALGHVGDSRAYLQRDGELSQLTSDHTFVQSLIDEGRITEEEARVHPHRNLILKALDGLHDVEPDLFTIELVAGDRLFLCSDGACGVLDDRRIADILTGGTPEFSAIEMVRASLEAGSSDNVTCVVADVVPAPLAPTGDMADTTDAPLLFAEPQVVGAAADLKQRRPRGLFRGHRSGDTGELEPIPADIPVGVSAVYADPPDLETIRYAPRPPRRFSLARRLLALAVLVGLVWIGVATAYWWSQKQYYVGTDDDTVVIYRGVQVPGLSSVYRVSDLSVNDLSDTERRKVDEGIAYDNYRDAERKLRQLGSDRAEQSTDPADLDEPAPSSGAETDGGGFTGGLGSLSDAS
ncbi:serine/threonine-protein phosphatase [Nocardioides sp. zg-ZUI104]|uniref:PP2C family protein-serine/threonine phosphatase n=1 Tax=Nocardioides faecalis TaxID=2803858 RepID=UPI001BCBBB71|nr:protein phosphatase 2C domain-containing protein [Nocardioides faecalis]MBS4753231.1 serine/threonine-protein phosphatase [Nocardioides faecalis]